MPLAGKSIFPPPESADENGVIGFSGSLDCAMLADAYRHGIFPWPFAENGVIPWMFPAQRGVIIADEFHIPHSLMRDMKKFDFSLTVDQDFNAVISACAAVERPGQDGTWITTALISAYNDFHKAGYAHSFECRLPDGRLAGGLYGISVGRIFCGESMFYHVSGASKFAFVKMAQILFGMGVEVIDTQMVTNATSAFGAKEISGAEYLKLLRKYGGEPLDFSSFKEGY